MWNSYAPFSRRQDRSQAQLMALAVGSRLGHYQVTALIGEDGMGEVYRALDTKLDRDVALQGLLQARGLDSPMG